MASKIDKAKILVAAQKHVQRGQYSRAIREYRKIVEDDPKDVRIWLKIGDLYAKDGDDRSAVETYQNIADFYTEQGFYLKAVAVYKQIVKLDPDKGDVNIKLAELYRQLGLTNDAMRQYELVAENHQKKSQTEDAITALKQVVELDPDNVVHRIKLAELYSRNQVTAEGVQEFQTVADQLRGQGRIDDFIKVAERLLYFEPTNHALSKELAGLYLRQKEPKRALQKLQAAFKADPRDEETLEMLAQSFQDLERLNKAVSVLKELAQIHREENRIHKQLATFERILEIDPADSETRGALEAGRRDLGVDEIQPPDASASASPLVVEQTSRSNDSHEDDFDELEDELTAGRGELPEDDVLAIDLDNEDFVEELDLSGQQEFAVGEDERADKTDTVGFTEPPPIDALREAAGEEAEVLRGERSGARVTGEFDEDAPERVQFNDELDEANFFAEQGMFRESLAILERLKAMFPASATVQSRFADVSDLAAKAPPDEFAADDFTPVGSEPITLSSSSEEAETTAAGPVGEVAARARFKGRPANVIQPDIAEEDVDTHYDLAIAYREMGLLDEAIKEFRIAMGAPERRVMCQMMIGLCYVDQGQTAQGIAEMHRALETERVTDRETTAVWFELGQVHEAKGEIAEALTYFRKVSELEPDFRNVRERLDRLSKLVPVPSRSAVGSPSRPSN